MLTVYIVAYVRYIYYSTSMGRPTSYSPPPPHAPRGRQSILIIDGVLNSPLPHTTCGLRLANLQRHPDWELFG